MASTLSPEERELQLIDKVEMRIALTDDSKLETVLKTYLPPVILKLKSEQVAVRNKVSRKSHFEMPNSLNTPHKLFNLKPYR